MQEEIKSLSNRVIPVFNTEITFRNIISVIRCLIDGEISGNSKYVREFEEKTAQLLARKHAIAVTNGSVALDLAFQNLNLKSGDEVILPSFTIISCLSAIVRTGATPVFVDVDPYSWNTNLDTIEKAFTPKTKCVLLVHTYGLTSDSRGIENFCKERKISMIEDASEAIGIRTYDRMCGSFGDMSTLSFYANKHVTTGEGGMILTDCEDYAETLRGMRNLGFQEGNRFVHEEFWWNARMSGIQAALGKSQLLSFADHLELKQEQALVYNQLLEPHYDVLQMPLKSHRGVKNHYWVYGVKLKVENIRERVMKKLSYRKIETRPFFWPLHQQPVYLRKFLARYDLPVSEGLGRNGLYLPVGAGINKRKQEYVVRELISAIGQERNSFSSSKS
jgi:perosamine synthetase